MALNQTAESTTRKKTRSCSLVTRENFEGVCTNVYSLLYDVGNGTRYTGILRVCYAMGRISKKKRMRHPLITCGRMAGPCQIGMIVLQRIYGSKYVLSCFGTNAWID